MFLAISKRCSLILIGYGYGAPEPSYGAPEPSYGAPSDGYGAPARNSWSSAGEYRSVSRDILYFFQLTFIPKIIVW